jgi:uncharacterized protein YycO
MKVALYQGTSTLSRTIRFITRSPYSHAAFVFDEQTSQVARHVHFRGAYPFSYIDDGSVVEAWSSGVRNVSSISVCHDPCTMVHLFDFDPLLTPEEEKWMLLALSSEIGWPYDWKGVFRFITRRPGNLDRAWFCSELVFHVSSAAGRRLLNNTQAWEVPPDWLARVPGLRLAQTLRTDY